MLILLPSQSQHFPARSLMVLHGSRFIRRMPASGQRPRGPMMDELMDLRWAVLTIRDYVCSNCWGELEKLPARQPQHWLLRCRRCQARTRGFVSKYYAESRRSESHGELRETKQMLQELGIIPTPAPKSEQQLLREMGF